MAVLPANNPNMSFMNISPGLSLRQKALPALPKTLSLTDDPIFKNLYADNEATLRHFLETQDALHRDDLKDLFRFVEANGEPGVSVQYANIPVLLTAMKTFLGSSKDGQKLSTYFRGVLYTRGRYVVTTAELMAFDIVVKMTQALFVFDNDKQLYNHICMVIPEAPLLINRYTGHQLKFFDEFATENRKRLFDANADAITKLVALKTSKEFYRKLSQLYKAHEIHEAKLTDIRKRDALRKAERKLRAQATRARNEAGLPRQMGMHGLTPLTPQVGQVVVDYVEEVSEEFFPREDDQAWSEEHMVGGFSFKVIIPFH